MYQLLLMFFFVYPYQPCDSITDGLVCLPTVVTSYSFITSPCLLPLFNLFDSILRYSTFVLLVGITHYLDFNESLTIIITPPPLVWTSECLSSLYITYRGAFGGDLSPGHGEQGSTSLYRDLGVEPQLGSRRQSPRWSVCG